MSVDKLARINALLLPVRTPIWLHYTGRVLLGILSLPIILIVIPGANLTVKLGKWLHERGERAARAWEIMRGP